MRLEAQVITTPFRVDVDTLRRQVDLVKVAGRYVKLKKTGAEYVGLCPFHTEKTPSFTIYRKPGYQGFKCFGCEAAGDVFEFIQRIEGVDFPTALERVTEMVGV